MKSTDVHLGDDVELEYYRLQRMSEDSILVSEDGGVYVASETPEDEVAVSGIGAIAAARVTSPIHQQ